jgi:hypothetical protein
MLAQSPITAVKERLPVVLVQALAETAQQRVRELEEPAQSIAIAVETSGLDIFSSFKPTGRCSFDSPSEYRLRRPVSAKHARKTERRERIDGKVEEESCSLPVHSLNCTLSRRATCI